VAEVEPFLSLAWKRRTRNAQVWILGATLLQVFKAFLTLDLGDFATGFKNKNPPAGK